MILIKIHIFYIELLIPEEVVKDILTYAKGRLTTIKIMIKIKGCYKIMSHKSIWLIPGDRLDTDIATGWAETDIYESSGKVVCFLLE